MSEFLSKKNYSSQNSSFFTKESKKYDLTVSKATKSFTRLSRLKVPPYKIEVPKQIHESPLTKENCLELSSQKFLPIQL